MVRRPPGSTQSRSSAASVCIRDSAWYGALVAGALYEAGEFLDVTTYTNVIRWAKEIQTRPAMKRGQRVNRVWGAEEKQLAERHDASDFDNSISAK